MFYGFLLFIHILVSMVLVVSILMQSSKGGGLAGTFGGSGVSGGVFGGRGAAPFLIKVTTVCAVIFLMTCLSINFIKPSGKMNSVIERTINKTAVPSEPAVQKQMPAAPSSGPNQTGAPASGAGK